ncbi:MAG: hypothetical protein WDO13_15880 [Verrucomicrobiota bacterium]
MLRVSLAAALFSPVLFAGPALAQDAVPAAAVGGTAANPWQRYDWLAAPDEHPSPSAESFKTSATQVFGDPFAVISSDALWHDGYSSQYTRRMDDGVWLSCDTSNATLDPGTGALSKAQTMGLQFQPDADYTFQGDFHGSSTDALIPDDTTSSSGAALSAEGHLPNQSILSVGLHLDRTEAEIPSGLATQTNAYDAQFQQPLGSLPVSAVLKSHFENTTTGGAPAGRLPSLEQSLVWKPLTNTTVQMGVRQQQYQEYPGIDHALNEALFADWSQKMSDTISWHSYAEVLNSKGLYDQAPASALATGANGTPQANNPPTTAV